MKPGRPRKERYARLMGGFWRNDKVRRLSLEARGLLATAWSYSADQMTDGRVPVELLEGWAKKRFAPLMEELKGFLAVVDIDAVAHDWCEINITAEEWERRLEGDRERKWRRKGGEVPPGNPPGNSTGNPTGNPPEVPPGNPPHFQRGAPTKTKTRISSYKEEHDFAADEPPRPSLSELESRYPAALAAEARAACALSRKNGRMADSVWATTLERLAAFPAPCVERAMRTFVDKHADGDKSEAYLIAIARGEAKRGSNGRKPPSEIDPDEAAASVKRAFAIFEGGKHG